MSAGAVEGDVSTSTGGPTKVVYVLDHDFNNGRNEGGYHEVLLDLAMERNVHTGDEVTVSDGEIQLRGRVRCIVAVVEDIGQFEGVRRNA